LRRAVDRAIATTAGDRTPITLFDFGFGTGRVTNEFVAGFTERYGHHGRGLRVIAYDISAVGLRKAEEELKWRHQFEAPSEIKWDDEASTGYVAGSLERDVRGTKLNVVFVHGNEAESPANISRLVRAANNGPALITTSWYSGLGHIPGRDRRTDFVRMLDRVTDLRGELLIAPSVSGDLVEAQAEWAEKLRSGDVGDYPIEVPGDVMYETELQDLNFWHVFSTDLEELIRRVCRRRQRAWIEALRMPGPEFRSLADEQENYRQTQLFNLSKRRRPWRHSDYRRVHTAVAVRSGSPRAR
jgi:hypothetical protein